MRWLTVTLALTACGSGKLVHFDGELAYPDAVAFEPAWVGVPSTRSLELKNSSNASLQLHAQLSTPFSIDLADFTVEAGAIVTPLLTFLDSDEAPVSSQLVLSDGAREWRVALSAQARVAPACAADPCLSRVFNPATGKCDATVLADGTACALEGVCFASARCVAGSCLAETAVSCDDSDACTLDACESLTGCVHFEGAAACPAPANPCQVATCDSKAGCGVVDALDGTPCGKTDCVTADVCLEGVCKKVAVPEGYECAPKTPCQERGVCENQTCVRPPAQPLQELWRYQQLSPDAQFSGVADEEGNLFWVECEAQCFATSIDANGARRFHTLVGTDSVKAVNTPQLLTEGRFVFAGAEVATAVSARDGTVLWRTETVNASEPPWQIEQLAADGVGQIYLVVAQAYSVQLPPPLRSNPGLRVLAASTGALLRQQPFALLQSLIVDEGHNTYARTSTTVESFTADGGSRWSVLAAQNPLDAVYNGEIAQGDGTVRLASSGTTSVPSASGVSIIGKASVLGLNGRAWLHDDSADCFTCDGSRVPNPALSSFAPRSSLARATVQFSGLSRPGALVLDQHGSSLISRFDAASGKTFLESYDPGGQQLFQCELPGPIDSNVVLTPGQLTVQTLAPSQIFPHPTLRAFAVPGVAPATKGWVTRGGDFSRAFRPRGAP